MNGFSLPSHSNLSPQQSAEIIADHFSQISQEYPPINSATLPERVKEKLNQVSVDDLPLIFLHELFGNIQKTNKPKAGVP